MESIEHRLGEAHLAGCLALSRAARWNQNEADWRLMLSMGQGWGLTLGDGALAASTLVLPYGRFAWISMVLVDPAHRRKGYASRLLRTAIGDLSERRLTPILDATPAGREIYRQEGFSDRWGFRRFVLKETTAASGPGETVRALRAADWQWVLALDAEAFGASREALLRALAARLPQAALVVDGRGFVLGRDGREARQIGPLVARDEAAAAALFAHAVRAVEPPLYTDVADHARLPRFEFQRPFTRMVHGAQPAPGNRHLVHLVAGPELG